MCNINCICLFNLLVAAVLFILQQQQHAAASKVELQQHHQQQHLQQNNNVASDDGTRISSYAAAAAANYLRHTSLPHRVIKREIKDEKSTDFIAYLNDFNIQDETSIPEDIIDQQHLQEIIDKQQQNTQQQTQSHEKLQQKLVGESTAVASVVNGDDDIIDVNLPFDDSADTDSDADIILESQRFSERSDDNKTTSNSGNSNKNDSEEDEMFSEEKHEIDKNKKNYLKTFNKKEMLKEKKILNANNDNKDKDYKQEKIKHKNNIDYSNQYHSFEEVEEERALEDEGDEDKFEIDVDDEDDGSAEYERFKRMHEQKQKELQKQKEQMSTQKPLTDEQTLNNQYSSEEMAQHNTDYADDNNNRNRNINDYEIFHKHVMQQRQKLLKQNQQYRQPQPIQDAIGDIEDNEDPNIFKTISTSNNNNHNRENENKIQNIFIPRKIKRHNGAARLDDNTNKFTRNKQEEPEQQQHQQMKSQIDSDENHPDVVAKVSSQEENFKKKYYDILKENSTSASEHHMQTRHHSSGELNPKDLSFYDENTERESNHDDKKQTAFEKEKSLRRNNKRYGHKTHKKKYKDYLRYSQIMMTAPTSSTPPEKHNLTQPEEKMSKDNNEHMGLTEDDVADLNLLKDKHVKKLKREKLQTLIPAAPIFVLKAHKEEMNKEKMKEMDEVEEPTTKPFYEGQINYFLETPDDDSERANEVRFIAKGDRMDTSDWYRKLSPVLRNSNKKINPMAEERSGIGVGRSRGGYSPYKHYRAQHHGQIHHGQTRNHHYHQQYHHQQQQGRPAHHRQPTKHSRHHAYQRKIIPHRPFTTTTPLPLPSRHQMASSNGLAEMGHQITDINDLDRYYAKWPHLARVQSQLHEEHMREQQMENYPDYEYDNDDYFEENENKDENLPPYIRKFNRRNKQLLDLLEGTIAPPTKPPQQLRWSGSKLQPGPRDSSVGSMSVHIDDDYLKEKRKRYHQRQRQIKDLFAQQKTSTTTRAPPPYPYVNTNLNGDEVTAQQFSHTENHLPDEDVSISLESNEQENEFASSNEKIEGGSHDDANDDDSQAEQEIWQKEIENKSAGNSQKINWQMEKLITSAPIATAGAAGAALATATKKSAIHKLPSYPSIAGGYMNRPRSRSAQFAPSSGSDYRRAPIPYLNSLNNNNDNTNNNNNNNNFINAGGFVAYNKAPVVSKTINGRFSANIPHDYVKQHQHQHQQQSVSNTTTTSPEAAKTQSSSSNNNQLNSPSPSASSSSVTNSFIYHRVVDASPRFVGAGFIAGRKQRLPFVAITDRRLETSKKSLTDHQKDFEQNHYPLP